MNKNKPIYVYGFLFICIFSTLFHFLYDINSNLFFSIFSAVNKSVGEHIKIIIISMFLYSIVEYLKLYKKEKYNIWLSLMVRSLIVILVITFGYLLYFNILNKSVLYIDLFLFYFSIFISQLVGYKLTKRTYDSKKEKLYFQICVIILLCFILFTFVPPNISLFKDEITGTYGIFKNIY